MTGSAPTRCVLDRLLLKQLVLQPRSGEVASGAGGRARQVAVEIDVAGGNVQLRLQPLDQADQLCDLLIGEGALVAVAHQADGDGAFVVFLLPRAADMGPGQLVDPAITDVDDAVAQPIAVADYEVIAK